MQYRKWINSKPIGASVTALPRSAAGRHRPPKKKGVGWRHVAAAAVLTFGATAAAFAALPDVYAQVMGPDLNAETAKEACLTKGRELARSVEEDSGVGAYGTTVTIDDVTVDVMTMSGEKHTGLVTLHQLATNSYGSQRGKKSVGCVVSLPEGADEIYATLVPLG
jgi:hypothetical protein